MLPWEGLANQDNNIGPARCFGELQVFPPSADDEEPTSSRHVEEVQFPFA